MNRIKSKSGFLLWPAMFAMLAVTPLFVPEGYARILIMAHYLAIFAISWDILSGHTGYISFGHTLLIATAGYTSAILSYPPGVWPISALHLGLPLYVTIPAGIALATIIGSVFFIPGLKTRGAYFVLVTLAAGIVGERIAMVSGNIGGASRGLFGYPTLALGFIPNFYISLTLMCVIGFTFWYISRSDMGRLLRAISMDETALGSLGKNVLKLKAIAFFLSAFVAGIGGAFFFHYLGSISPHSAFSFFLLIEIILAAIIGGKGTIIGPIIGAYFLTFILEGLRPLFPGALGPGRILVYLIIGLTIYLIMPKGLYPTIKRLLKF
jgi:branched-chain amino acid transport system permease protein